MLSWFRFYSARTVRDEHEEIHYTLLRFLAFLPLHALLHISSEFLFLALLEGENKPINYQISLFTPDYSTLRFRGIIILLLFMARIIVGSTQRKRKISKLRSLYSRPDESFRSQNFLFHSRSLKAFLFRRDEAHGGILFVLKTEDYQNEKVSLFPVKLEFIIRSQTKALAINWITTHNAPQH